VPELIAGFDAGQTHTTCRLADAATGLALADGTGPGVQHLASPKGPEAFRQAISLSLAAARHGAGLPQDAAPIAAAIGASGIEVDQPVQRLGQQLAGQILALPRSQVVVTGDERTALQGAMGPAAEGIVLISGTGTIAVGRNRAGSEHRCAGWGWLLDGAGSAMDIGRDGLSCSLEMEDGRRADSPLRQQLWQALGLDPSQSGAAATIKAQVVQPDFGAAGFAALAPVVAKAAAAGDTTATAILNRHGRALARMAVTIDRILKLESPAVWPLGGGLTHLEGLHQALAETLSRQLPHARLATPAGDACTGALSFARACLGQSGVIRPG